MTHQRRQPPPEVNPEGVVQNGRGLRNRTGDRSLHDACRQNGTFAGHGKWVAMMVDDDGGNEKTPVADGPQGSGYTSVKMVSPRPSARQACQDGSRRTRGSHDQGGSRIRLRTAICAGGWTATRGLQEGVRGLARLERPRLMVNPARVQGKSVRSLPACAPVWQDGRGRGG